MSSSITERILGNNNLYTDKYYKDTILLTKSVVVVSFAEAGLYNEYVSERFGVYTDLADKSTWRYYKHLTGSYHPVDTPISLVSMDNRETITLTKDTIDLHRATRDELLKFDYYYKELVDKYPDQELLIKNIINKTPNRTMEEVLTLPEYSIVSYNSTLVETQESNLLPNLQLRIDTYKVTKMLPYYGNMESYFVASLFHVLYSFIFTTILNLRLANAKTHLAHSYHILNYLASHHNLDKQFMYLTKEQNLFLYRNLLYLDNHSGRNDTFETLIEKLFTAKRVSVVNYRLKQKNDTAEDGTTTYRYNQTLLNKADLVYDPNDFTLQQLRDKEISLAPSNEKEYRFNEGKIDFKNKNTLDSYLMTKDLEVNLVDNSNDVRHTLIPMIIDYWGHLLSKGKHNFISTIIDPVTNNEYSLDTKDMFKLFSVVLHKLNNVDLVEFPEFTSSRVLADPLPSDELLYSKFYKPGFILSGLCAQVRNAIPAYYNITTPYTFNVFISGLYSLNLGLWLFLTNQADKNINAQLDMYIENLHNSTVYSFNDESVAVFLKRIGFSDVLGYNLSTLTDIVSNILNSVTYNKLGDLSRNKYVQEALVQVFKKFNSYTTQLIDKYYSSEAILCNIKSPLYTIDVDSSTSQYVLTDYGNYIDLVTKHTIEFNVHSDEGVRDSVSMLSVIEVPLSDITDHYGKIEIDLAVDLVTPSLLGSDDDDYILSPPDQDLLTFLYSAQ